MSVLVTVLLGALALLYLSEALGWSFGGLVVPGYLAAVLSVSPAAGVTVMVEAALTWGCATLLSDGLARTGIWSNFFGRERFLLLVLVSVLVRQASEVWLWPAALDLQTPLFGRMFIEPDDAHSIGLVLVPLTANVLAKGRNLDGVFQLAVPTFITWGLLWFVVLPSTNLSLGALALTHQDVSLDFLHSGRAYVVLCTGAMLAARLNGAFAWSAGGILIPALIALAWYEPSRLVATLLEAAVIAATYNGLARLPGVQRFRLEGSRQLAVLFALTTGLRVGLAWAHASGLPVHGTLEDGVELSGIGFLVSGLLAGKIVQFRSFTVPTLPAIGTSFTAFIAGSLAAVVVDRVVFVPFSAAPTETAVPSRRALTTPGGVVEYARVRARADAHPLPASQLSLWRRWWNDALVGETFPPAPVGLLLTPGPQQPGQRPWWVLHEPTENLDEVRGWGVGWLRPGAGGPLVAVRSPWFDPHGAHNAIAECLRLDCAAVLFSGVDGVDTPAWNAVTDGRRGVVFMAGNVGSNGADLPLSARGSVAETVLETVEEAGEPWVASETELEMFSASLAPSLAGPDPTSARAAAAALGLVLEEVACGRDRCVIARPEMGVPGPVIVARRGGAPVFVAVPDPRGEPGTAHLGLWAFHYLRARVLVVDPTRPAREMEGPSHALFLGWRRRLVDEPESLAVWIRGFGRGTPEAPRPEAAVVAGLGYPAPPSPWMPQGPAARMVVAAGAQLARGGLTDFTLTGSALPGPAAARTLGGPPTVVTWFSKATREGWRVEPRASFVLWAAAAGLTVADRSADGPATPSQRPAVNLDLALRAARQHNLDLLRGLVLTHDVSAGWDPDRGLGFLEISHADGAYRVWVAPGAGETVRVPASFSADTLREAIGLQPHDVSLSSVPLEGP